MTIEKIKEILNSPESYSEDLAVGWRVLVAIEKPKEKTEGGIYIPDRTRREEEGAAIVGKVVAIGDQAFVNREGTNFNKPWCKVGQKVFFKAYAGTVTKNLALEGYTFRTLNDIDIIKPVNQGELEKEESFRRSEDYEKPTYGREGY
jgi:co-chaperonin GroES (HSP10)